MRPRCCPSSRVLFPPDMPDVWWYLPPRRPGEPHADPWVVMQEPQGEAGVQGRWQVVGHACCAGVPHRCDGGTARRYGHCAVVGISTLAAAHVPDVRLVVAVLRRRPSNDLAVLPPQHVAPNVASDITVVVSHVNLWNCQRAQHSPFAFALTTA